MNNTARTKLHAKALVYAKILNSNSIHQEATPYRLLC
uniref:Uncharacterized protein n=1 Tax=Anguilla anguilla TaxID=7936 RepID=A0A0E9XQQ4_ANGAN